MIGEAIPGFVRQVTFKNGKGSNEPPMWVGLITSILLVVMGALITGIVTRFIHKYRATSKELKELEVALGKSKENFNELATVVEGFLAGFKTPKQLTEEEPKPVDNSSNINKKGS